MYLIFDQNKYKYITKFRALNTHFGMTKQLLVIVFFFIIIVKDRNDIIVCDLFELTNWHRI